MTRDTDDIIDCMVRYKGENQPFAVATVVRTEDSTAGHPGDKAVIRADGTITGWVGGGCTLGAVKKAAMAALNDGMPRLIRVRPKETMAADHVPGGIELYPSSCPSKGVTEVFVEPVLPRARLLIVGTSPVAVTLSRLARAMGYVVTVAGVPEDLAAFEDAHHRLEGFDAVADAGAFRYVVVASQGKRDRDALKAGLATGADYVAFVGSTRKARKITQDFADAGVDPARLACIHSPAGLSIGAVTPDEIALAVMAEIVKERRLGAADRSVVSPASVRIEPAAPVPVAEPAVEGACCGGKAH